MTSIIDVWRAVDPDARLVSGDQGRLARPVRAVARSRAAPPHLPPEADGRLLVIDAAIVPGLRLDELLAALLETDVEPAAVWAVGTTAGELEAAGHAMPVIAGAGTATGIADAVAAFLEHEPEHLAQLANAIRLSGAEAALVDPEPSAAAGVVAARLRRGVAVSVDGALRSLNPRAAGRALATRFAAAHARLLSARGGTGEAPQLTRDGLWVMERPVGPGASAWLFDDLPFASVDATALDALAVTLRALLRRRPPEPGRARAAPRIPPSTGDPIRDTLLAVARSNGRIAPAARALGVHRNTVLYRLRRASTELGIDPRRPEDALRLLREAPEAVADPRPVDGRIDRAR